MGCRDTFPEIPHLAAGDWLDPYEHRGTETAAN